MCKSPIILGNDLSKISSATLAIVKNKVMTRLGKFPQPWLTSPRT
jgi:hypothetical protein